MANEFFVTSVKEKCTYFDVTCRELPPVVIRANPALAQAIKEADWKDAKMVLGPPDGQPSPCPGFIEKMPGRKSVKIKLESAGAYDIDLLNAALNSGKKVKITIVE